MSPVMMEMETVRHGSLAATVNGAGSDLVALRQPNRPSLVALCSGAEGNEAGDGGVGARTRCPDLRGSGTFG
ncbi:long-chain-fatty-acid--CoA ligase [Anopheles sinensis]|uniref:Long-chain-fatty-acid--CoA ligase n=1 Tax=Anopheles sinensis TaxID=74873 RepID=A0A084VKD4_ANOSI|nr:long-chain-fatty-acid--CoA ligase [Anopheles sinensis]